MKIQIHRKCREQGTMLLVTAMIAVVAGSTLAYFLTRAQQESFVVNRSEAWNKALVVAEAGIEEGMSLINRNSGSATALTNWDTGASADGWTVSTTPGAEIYTISRDLGNNMGSYSVSITNTYTGPAILAIGKANCRNSLMNKDTVSRKILVYASSSSAFPGALTVKSTIDLKGNNVTIDSYDSSDPLHSYWPTYPLAPGYGLYTNTDTAYNVDRKANGNVATDGSIIDVGNANIYGHADTAPGGNTAVGANGSVGDLTWVGLSTHGIEAGYSQDDMNVAFPDVTVPTNNWISFSGTSITNSGNYTMDSISTDFSITASNVVLYLTNGLYLNGHETVSIGSNAGVTIYAGNRIDDGGHGVINNGSQHPSALIIYGLPTMTQINLHGNGAMYAAIYAPEADVSFKGGGSAGGFNGALTGNSVVLTGNSTFSYDEALSRLNMKSGYVIQSWIELVGP